MHFLGGFYIRCIFAFTNKANKQVQKHRSATKEPNAVVSRQETACENSNDLKRNIKNVTLGTRNSKYHMKHAMAKDDLRNMYGCSGGHE